MYCDVNQGELHQQDTIKINTANVTKCNAKIYIRQVGIIKKQHQTSGHYQETALNKWALSRNSTKQVGIIKKWHQTSGHCQETALNKWALSRNSIRQVGITEKHSNRQVGIIEKHNNRQVGIIPPSMK